MPNTSAVATANMRADTDTVWEELVGQEHVVTELQRVSVAVATNPLQRVGASSWLFTGPPGSGRSNAARAFAAALQCEADAGNRGCGQCESCRMVRRGNHPGVRVVATETLSHSVADMRALVTEAARLPAVGHWQIIIIEDADRLTDQAANALLKAIEEPHPHTWWLLCAPTADDVLPTIRSRCRLVRLRTPSALAVAQVLMRRDGIEPTTAQQAAAASHGHVGRARWLASDPEARSRRQAVLAIPTQLTSVSSCTKAAAQLLEWAQQEADEMNATRTAHEREALAASLGVGEPGVKAPPGATAQLKEFDRTAKARSKRLQRDVLDRALVDLAGLYREVLALQWGVATTSEQSHAEITALLASRMSAEDSVASLNAIMQTREALQGNVAALLAIEVLMMTLRSASHTSAGNGR